MVSKAAGGVNPRRLQQVSNSQTVNPTVKECKTKDSSNSQEILQINVSTPKLQLKIPKFQSIKKYVGGKKLFIQKVGAGSLYMVLCD